MRLLFALVLAVAMTGCATKPLSELEVRSIEEKVFEGTYDDAFKATLQVLQDKGYVVENTDFAGGTINASTMKQMRRFSGGLYFRHIASVTVEQFGENNVKERISVMLEASQGNRYLAAERERDLTYVQGIYDAIQKEIFVRRNLNK